MSFERITIPIEDEETERLLGSSEDQYEIEVEAYFDYEPADPSVGIPRESFGVYKIVKANGRELTESDLNGRLWERINDLLVDKITDLREEAKLEHQLRQRGL